MAEDEVSEEQVNIFKTFASLFAPVDFLLFGSQKSLGLLKETPLEGILRDLDARVVKRVVEEEKKPEEKITWEHRLERKPIYGMWQSGF